MGNRGLTPERWELDALRTADLAYRNPGVDLRNLDEEESAG